jgi:hypothetical protein
MYAMNAKRPACARTAALILAGFALASCSSGRAVDRTREGMDDAVLSPLGDLNLRKAPIPALLEAIQSPYQPVVKLTCPSIAAEVVQLTEVLGPDSDAHLVERSLSEKTADGAADLALRSVTSTVTGFIPYRSVLRQASGASAHERRLKAAYDRGVQRRAYLKGLGASLGCAPPAGPHPDAGLAPEKDD